jgi:hypothetical protein
VTGDVMPPAVITLDDLRPGTIVWYRHVSRARRLAGKALLIRRGRVEQVLPNVGEGQVTVTVLNKDGSPHAKLGRITLHYAIDFIVSVERRDDAVLAKTEEIDDGRVS